MEKSMFVLASKYSVNYWVNSRGEVVLRFLEIYDVLEFFKNEDVREYTDSSEEIFSFEIDECSKDSCFNKMRKSRCYAGIKNNNLEDYAWEEVSLKVRAVEEQMKSIGYNWVTSLDRSEGEFCL